MLITLTGQLSMFSTTIRSTCRLGHRRLFHTTCSALANRTKSSGFQIDPNYKLKCGLEIHTQLDTQHKLFSLSKATDLNNQPPNSQVSFFDLGLPGTQPVLNYEAVLQALKLAIVLNCDINEASTFDRKHYFYGDQPLGYQITQHYNPIARDGEMTLSKRYDDIDEDRKLIRFEQLQLEQDTGRSIYKKSNVTEIDYNRANVPLVELVTLPDFENLKQIRAFIRKFQLVLKKIKVSTAELETGAMRIDVNLSINNGERVELKNLSNTTAILNAVKFEYQRQVQMAKDGHAIKRETRGWDNTTTFSLRSKEDSTDYRYMPDPELPCISLDVPDLKANIPIPELPNEFLDKMMKEPYNCKLRDAMILLQNPKLLHYHSTLFGLLKRGGIDPKIATNWCCHEFQGALTKLAIDDIEESNENFQVLPVEKFAEMIQLIHSSKIISNNNAKFLFLHLLTNPKDQLKPLEQLIDEFGIRLEVVDNIDDSEISRVIQQVMEEHSEIVAQLKEGQKLNSINFLLGQSMRLTKGKYDNKLLLAKLKKCIFD